jgi:D-alanine-D-alanine ligase
VDFRLDEAEGDKPYILEINPLPGLNPTVSDLCIMARAEGMRYTDLINEILYLAADRYAKEGSDMERQASGGNRQVRALQDSALHAWATVPVAKE